MPEPKFTNSAPPPDGKSARARGPVTPPEAEDVVASLEPDDDLNELAGGAPSAPASSAPKREKGEKILIHIREDGFTANGRVWYRGQELEYEVGSDAYEDTIDRHKTSWLDLSENDQIRRYGRVMFGFGAWPGGTYENEKALAAERLRGRTPPTIGKLSSSQP